MACRAWYGLPRTLRAGGWVHSSGGMEIRDKVGPRGRWSPSLDVDLICLDIYFWQGTLNSEILGAFFNIHDSWWFVHQSCVHHAEQITFCWPGLFVWKRNNFMDNKEVEILTEEWPQKHVFFWMSHDLVPNDTYLFQKENAVQKVTIAFPVPIKGRLPSKVWIVCATL